VTDDPNVSKALGVISQDENYRVLKRLPTAGLINADVPDSALVGVIVDVETTGLDLDIDEVIELGMIKFTFGRDGRIGRVADTFQSFNEPRLGIPAAITQITGIHNEDVKGQKISAKDIEAFINNAVLIIAHNAAFDRPFCEGLFTGFSSLPWACSATEIDWRSEGISGGRLEYIATSFGGFYDAHRALDDCNAVMNIVSYKLPRSQRLALEALLTAARRVDIRIFAEGAPYELRLPLKRAGYRWNDGQNGYPRAWWKDVEPDRLDNELATLAEMGDGWTSPKLVRMTARNRFRQQV
jgi:DNA polymerase III subunit epsilon